MQQYLTIWDLVLTPVFLGIIVFLAKSYRDKAYPFGHPLRKYYLPGLYAKLGGAVFIGLIYQYYYGAGDTYNYFTHAQIINSSLNTSFETWVRLMFGQSPDTHPELYQYTSQMYWYGQSSTYTVCRVSAILGLFNGTTYMPIALMFAFVSYTGVWAMYRTFVNVYPKLQKPLAIAFLFIPSFIVWGSSVFKDTVCIFALGWMTFTTFRIFVNRDFSLKNFILLIISFLLLATIKVYILVAFMPALAFWLLSTYSHRITSASLRFLAQFLVLGILGVSFWFFSKQFSQELNRYSLDTIVQTAQSTRGWISYVSDREEGSKYDVGEIDPSVSGLAAKFPAAVNVTLYRPYLWEVKNPLMLLSALESLVFLLLTLIIFYRVGFFKTFRKIFSDPNLLFFFSFTLIFAFSVGISTGNFGSLSRYKIPCMPFFAALLLVLYYQTKPPVHKIQSHERRQSKIHYIS